MRIRPNAKLFRLAAHSGFTLLEMLLVVSIMGVLLALTLPAVQHARAAAARLQCQAQMKQMAMAAHNYSDSHQCLPQGCGYPLLTSTDQLKYQAGISWQTSILPYIEQEQLWNLAWSANSQDPSGTDALASQLTMTPVKGYVCPVDSREIGIQTNGFRWALTSYLGVAGTGVRKNDGIFHRNYTVRFADITDGTSTTLMIGERPPGPEGIWGAWYANWGSCVCQHAQILPAAQGTWIPLEGTNCTAPSVSFRPGQITNACDVNHFWSLHTGGANFAFADGSVRFISYAQADLMAALATRAGDEVVNLD
jgi:prepilin-type N-terminal cleavage/methylation domain-containing protein/prepilin-type processing-associated H-X9-DG protein